MAAFLYFTVSKKFPHLVCYNFDVHEPVLIIFGTHATKKAPASVAEWSTHSATMCSRVWRAQWPGFDLAPGASAYQRIISNNSYTHYEQGDNPGQEKEGSTVFSINCDRCRHLDLAVSSLPAAPAWVEVNRLGWPPAGILHSTSQG